MMSSISRSDYQVEELRWENGQVANYLNNGNIINPQMFNQTWDNNNNNQSTFNTIFPQHDHLAGEDDHVKFSTKFMPTSAGGKRDRNSISGPKWTHENSLYMGMDQNMNPMILPTFSGGKYGEDSSPAGNLVKKRIIRIRRKSYDQVDEGASERSGCASHESNATDDHTTMMTCPSFDPYNNPNSASSDDEERKDKGESSRFRSRSSARTSRAAAVHNQSERRRRDRINQKMKALQKLVPNASKTDKASMLDEVIEYLKQLQAQVRMMSNARSCIMPQMMMPLGMQQQIQMSYLARMGMGMGNVHSTLYPFTNGLAPLGGTATPSFLSPLFGMHPVAAPPSSLKANTFVPNFNEAYKTLLTQQSMNLDFFNKVAAFHERQQTAMTKGPDPI